MCVLLAGLLALPAPADKSQWVEVSSPNFIVVSNGGQATAQRVAVQFEQIRVIFRKALPYASAHESPAITVIAAKDEKSLRELLPEYWEKGHSHIAGVFFFRMNKYYVALRSDLEGPYAYEPIYHEYFHSISLPYMPGLPLWLAEGFADFYGNTAMVGKEALLGRPNEGSLEELRSQRLIPLEVLLKVDQSSPYYNEQNKTSVFYAESWALVHYLMLGDKSSHRQLLYDYLGAFAKGADAVESGRKAFGDLGQFQKQLSEYIGRFAFYEIRMPQAPEISEKHFPERALSAAESDAIRGDFEAYRGKKDLAGPLLEEAEKADPKLALPHESKGILAYTAGQHLEALHELNKAVELDPQNFRTLFFRSYLAFHAHGEGSLNEQVETDLRRSIALNPNFPAAYGLLASYLAAKNEKLQEALGFANKAVDLEPGTSAYQINLGEVLVRLHQPNEAIAAGRRADRVARGFAEHAFAMQFLSYARNMASYEADQGTAEASVKALAPEKPGTRPAGGGGSDGDIQSDANEPRPMEAETPAEPPAPEPASKQDAPKQAADHDEFSAKGRISKVACTGRQIAVSLDFGTSRLQLQNADFGKLEISRRDSTKPAFNICTELQGRQATITYSRSDSAQNDGTILRIELAP